MFTTFIVQPVFNLLVLIYALLPGHNFGVAIILFTIVIRLLLWPLVRRQLHQTKMMRRLQPELRRIKKEAKGDRQKEQVLSMALYKEHGVSPFGTIGIALLQAPILFALYDGLTLVVKHPGQIVTFAYPALQQLPWMQGLAHNIHQFDVTFLGVVDLTKSALGATGIYWPAIVLVLGSAVVQYFQGRQLLVTDKNARSIWQILREAGDGKEADQAEVSAAVGKVTLLLMPALILYITIRLPAALGLYWLVGGLIAYAQQALILRTDETELEALADTPAKRVDAIPEAEVVSAIPPEPHHSSKTKTRRAKRRRKK